MTTISTISAAMPLGTNRLPDVQATPSAEAPASLSAREGRMQGPPPPNPAMFIDPATGTTITQFYGPNGVPSVRLESPRALEAYRVARLSGAGGEEAASTFA